MAHKILLLKGDGIGPEIVDATLGVLLALRERFGLALDIDAPSVVRSGTRSNAPSAPSAGC